MLAWRSDDYLIGIKNKNTSSSLPLHVLFYVGQQFCEVRQQSMRVVCSLPTVIMMYSQYVQIVSRPALLHVGGWGGQHMFISH